MRKLTKKMKVKDENGAIKVTQSVLRSGGMQGRLYRQEIIRHGDSIREHVKKVKDREQNNRRSMIAQALGHELEEFKEPVFRRIRSKRGFFNDR